MSKLTEWFPGHIKPVRDGVYQQKSGSLHAVGYQLFKKGKWMIWEETPERAALAALPCATGFQNDPWRGLAEPPKETP